MTRPYLQSSSQELEELARQHWGSAPELLRITHELQHRTTPKAQRLERQISGRLIDLGIPTDATSASAAQEPSATSSELQRLRHDLSRSEQLLRETQGELTRLRAELAQSRSGTADPNAQLYAKVGLHPNCPDFLVISAQRVWRKEYHPDALSDRPESERRKAEEVFKHIDGVFARIQLLRQ